ncbi:uncharacterized protein LOC133923751 [Phragmites australis]|uniref:uncharacterized protein LOC133923751 n=1 Tax=Phragmites australis TaxID=29695 RepID=UPI002D776CFA|nr:uncharacterized protein LOC133923751 [Phragmites australis]
MFDVWSAVQWWDEWQLRILVLGSLCLQWFLLLAAPMRKYTIPYWFRKCIWLAYISSDALAIYALATLFNRHSKATTSSDYGVSCTRSKASILEILWAPVLLIHLGGQEELTAYSIEDNELWIRHTVTLVSQVTVALYAFYKSWPSSSDWRLLASAILLFIIGVLSFCEKPWALNKASINRLAAVSAVVQGTKKRAIWRSKLNEFFFFDEAISFTKSGDSDGDKVYMVVSDMSLSAAADDLVRRRKATSVWDVLRPIPLRPRALQRWLRGAFGVIYTRANVVFTPTYLAYHVLVVPVLHIAALTLFAMSHKHPYNYTDVKTTYVLLSFTAALDVLAVFIRQLLYLGMSKAGVPALCETVPGYNLIDAVLRRSQKDIGWLVKCATRMGFKEEYFVFKGDDNYKLYRKVSGSVLAEAVKTYGRDLASYRFFEEEYAPMFSIPKEKEPEPEPAPAPCPSQQQPQHAVEASSPDHTETSITRSSPDHNDTVMLPRSPPWSSDTSFGTNWILRKELQKDCSPEIRKSLCRSFDRSVLLWHIATDICFRMQDYRPHDPPSPGGWWCTGSSSETEDGDPLSLRKECTQAISNYMAHLLIFHPEMLMTGSRQHLVTEAMNEMEHFLEGDKNRPSRRLRRPRRDDLKKMIDKTTNEQDGHHDKDFHIVEACKIAKELLALTEETRWAVMYYVWVGMLCYSASMCRGYLHAKSLGEGGEFLSFVWLVLSLKGAKTLADKLQMPDPADQKAKEESPPEASSSTPKPKKKLVDPRRRG